MAQHKGCIPWNKGQKVGRASSTSFKPGVASWNKGSKGVMKPGPTSFKKGERPSQTTEFGKGHAPWNKGIKNIPWSEARRKAHVPKIKTKPVLVGGKEYHPLWHEIRKIVYRRDRWTCQECGSHCHRRISAHHIDYDTTNNEISNLVTLCTSCHGKTNFKRVDWILHFTRRMRLQ